MQGRVGGGGKRFGIARMKLSRGQRGRNCRLGRPRTRKGGHTSEVKRQRHWLRGLPDTLVRMIIRTLLRGIIINEPIAIAEGGTVDFGARSCSR